MTERLSADVVIVGGGLAGMATAIALRGQGLRIVLVEASGELGGRARSAIDATTGDTVDIGPHVVTAHHHHFLRLLDALGTRNQLVWQNRGHLAWLASPDDRFVARVLPWIPPLHLAWMGLRSRQLTLRQKLTNWRIGLLAMSLRKDALADLDAVSARALLQSFGVDQASQDWLWQAVAMTLLNVPTARLSAAALMRVVRQVVGHADLRIAMPARGLGDLFVPSARKRLEEDGGQVLLAAPAVEVHCVGGGFEHVRLADGTRIDARDAVLAVEPQTLARLLPAGALSVPASAALAALRPVPYVSVTMWFDRPLAPSRVMGRMWGRQGLAYDFYDLAGIRPGLAGRGSIIAANLIDPGETAQESDATLVERTLAEWHQMLPSTRAGRLLHSRVHRVPMAIPAAEIGTEPTRVPTRTGIDGLYLASDWGRTDLPASMESATCSAFQAAAALSDRRQIGCTLPPRPVPEPRGLNAWVQLHWPNLGLARVVPSRTERARFWPKRPGSSRPPT